jgi:hypothetical protein
MMLTVAVTMFGRPRLKDLVVDVTLTTYEYTIA